MVTVSTPAPPVATEDLRGFLRRVEEAGMLRRIPEAAVADIPSLMRQAELAGQTLFVEAVVGCEGEPGERCRASHVSNLLPTPEHLALAYGLGIGEARTGPRLVKEYIDRTRTLLTPVTLVSGSAQDIVLLGNEIDVASFPLLRHSPKDIARYVTAGMVIARDPETGIRNVSINRMQLKGSNRLGIRMMPPQHLGQIQQKAERMGQVLEVAVAIGNHPLDLLGATTSTDLGVDELSIAGSLRGAPLELVRCKTVDLEVPVNAEVVIEGEVRPGEREIEGPFGDLLQFYVPPMENHVLHVRAITHRERPLFAAIKAGSLEDTRLLATSREAALYLAARATGAEVLAISLGPTILNGAIAIRKRSEEEPRAVIEAAFACYPWLKYFVVVDHDVDVNDPADLWWAMATRSAPARGLIRIDGPGFGRDPHELHRSKLGIDATAPLDCWDEFERTGGFGIDRKGMSDPERRIASDRPTLKA
jgi:2,5-furandicarboxylate decarboxylase 1